MLFSFIFKNILVLTFSSLIFKNIINRKGIRILHPANPTERTEKVTERMQKAGKRRRKSEKSGGKRKGQRGEEQGKGGKRAAQTSSLEIKDS